MSGVPSRICGAAGDLPFLLFHEGVIKLVPPPQDMRKTRRGIPSRCCAPLARGMASNLRGVWENERLRLVFCLEIFKGVGPARPGDSDV